MKEPSKKDTEKQQRESYASIAAITAYTTAIILEVRKYVKKFLPDIKKSLKREIYYKQIEQHIIKEYTKMFQGVKQDLVNTLNKAGRSELKLAEKTLGSAILALKAYKALPATKAFQVTNKILSTKSILMRNKILSARVTGIIEKGVANGNSIQRIQRALDIEFGYRNSAGVLTEKGLNLIKQGKFAHKNGHIYETYRIARTEAMRMRHIQQYEIFDSLDREDKRLKLISVIDSRTRQQSIEMNNQISNKNGEFKYPDGQYYRLGTQPAKWLIHDREVAVVVFINE